MHDDDRHSSDLTETEVVPVETAVTREETVTLALADPRMLIEGLRNLQQRIPGFVQLSLKERRAMARAGHLDPELIELGLHAASVWRKTKVAIGRGAEDLRQEDAEIRLWDEVERELVALTKGIAAANLQRKHSLGQAILMLYQHLGISVQRGTSDAYMRPYYEPMKRILQRERHTKRRKAKQEKPETPEE